MQIKKFSFSKIHKKIWILLVLNLQKKCRKKSCKIKKIDYNRVNIELDKKCLKVAQGTQCKLEQNCSKVAQQVQCKPNIQWS